MYCSSDQLNKWLDEIKKYVNELRDESGKNDIGDLLKDGKHDGYVREFKDKIQAIISELDINID